MEFTVQNNNNNNKVALRRYVPSHSFLSVQNLFVRNTALKKVYSVIIIIIPSKRKANCFI